MKNVNKNRIKIIFLLVIIICFITTVISPILERRNDIKKGQGYIKYVANMSVARYMHSAILLKNGNVLILGGDTHNASRIAEIYNTEASRSIRINDSNYKHRNAKIFNLSDGKVLILDAGSIEVFNPVNNLFYKTNKCIMEKECKKEHQYFNLKYSATQVDKDKVFIVKNNDLMLYNAKNNEFEHLSPFTIPRINPVIVPLNNNKILVVGGYQLKNKKNTYIQKSEIYDIFLGKSTLIHSSPPTEEIKNYIELKNQNILLMGDKSASIYNTKSNLFYKVGDLNESRTGYLPILLNNGRVLIVGGYDSSNKPIYETELYDPETEKFSIGPKLLFPRIFHQLTMLDNGTILITGGLKEPNPFNLYDILFNTNMSFQKKIELYIPEEIINNKKK